jgi:putative membrane protein
MHFILRYLGTVAAVMLTVYVVPGIVVSGGWQTILLAALAWSVLVNVIKPVLSIITLPITVLTFGLFSLVLNAFLFYAMAWIVPGFVVTTFLAALLGALVLSILSWLIHQLL